MILSVNYGSMTAKVRLFRGAVTNEQLHEYSYWTMNFKLALGYAMKCKGIVYETEVDLPVHRIYEDYWGDGRDAVVFSVNDYYRISHRGSGAANLKDAPNTIAIMGQFTRPDREGNWHAPLIVGQSYHDFELNFCLGINYLKEVYV